MELKEKAQWSRLSAVGLELGSAVVIGVLAGYYFDQKMDSSPAGTLVGTLLGAAAGFRALWRAAMRKDKESDE